jgi:flagellar assembly factor FliW
MIGEAVTELVGGTRFVDNLIDVPAEPLDDGPVAFAEPLLGFPDDVAFTLAAVDPGRAMYTMRSDRDPGLRFILTPAGTFFPGYVVDADVEVRTALQVTAAEPLHLLLVVTVAGRLADATANLLAPVVVAGETRRAIQLLLVDSGLPVAAPLVP